MILYFCVCEYCCLLPVQWKSEEMICGVLGCSALEPHRKPKPAIQEPFPECIVSSF